MLLDGDPDAEPLGRRTATCGEVHAVLDVYVDCECDCDTMLLVAAHLDRCPDCAEAVLTVRWLKAAVRRSCGCREDTRNSRSWP